MRWLPEFKGAILLVAICFPYFLSGQTGDTIRDNSNYQTRSSTFGSENKTGDRYHYIGIHANQLLRQLIGSAGGTDNPVTFTYSFNTFETGVGLSLGLGFTFKTTDDSDQTISLKRTTKSNNLAFRFGYEIKKSLGKKWIAGFGPDVLITGGKSETVSDFSGGGSNVTTVSTKSRGVGFGPRGSLLFHVSEKIFLGTETTVYYTFNKTTSKSDTFSTQTELKEKSFQLGVPNSLFLILRF